MRDGPCMGLELELDKHTAAFVKAKEEVKRLQSQEPGGDFEKRLKWQDDKARAFGEMDRALKTLTKTIRDLEECYVEDPPRTAL